VDHPRARTLLDIIGGACRGYPVSGGIPRVLPARAFSRGILEVWGGFNFEATNLFPLLFPGKPLCTRPLFIFLLHSSFS
jgi:hypothetical protein